MQRGKQRHYYTSKSFHAAPTEQACVPLSYCYFAMAQNVASPLSRPIVPMVQPPAFQNSPQSTDTDINVIDGAQ